MASPSATNVVSLAAVRKARAHPSPVRIEATVNPDARLQVGDLIAWSCQGFAYVHIEQWLGSTGRDQKGRFCKPGSRFELFKLACGLTYSRYQLERGNPTIHGVVTSGRVIGDREPSGAA